MLRRPTAPETVNSAPETSNNTLNSSEMPQTTDYSAFQPTTNLGNGTWQFEENNLHVYDYTWSGTVASFNTTVNGGIIVTPTFCEGLLLVDVSNMTTHAGGVTAIDISTGQTVWVTTVPNLMMTQPITYEGLVIIGLGTGQFQPNTNNTVRGAGTNYVAALNLTNGETVWTFPTLGEDMPTPVIYNGLVVFPNGNAAVYALNATTGMEAWNVALPSGSFASMSSPAISGDSIYFGTCLTVSNQYAMECVNLMDHEISWSTPVSSYAGLDDASPVFWNGVVISGYVFKPQATGYFSLF